MTGTSKDNASGTPGDGEKAHIVVLIFAVIGLATLLFGVAACTTFPADAPWPSKIGLVLVPGLFVFLATAWVCLTWRKTRASVSDQNKVVLRRVFRPRSEEVRGELSIPQRIALFLCIIAWLAGGVVFNALDNSLVAFHKPGGAAFGIYDVTSFFVSFDHRARIEAEAITSWHDYLRPTIYDAGAAGGPAAPADRIAEPGRTLYKDADAPITILKWLLLIDSVIIIPAYGILLAILVLWAWRATVFVHYL